MSSGKTCYRCHSSRVVKCGLSSKGCQRYRCQGCGRSFTCQTEFIGYKNYTGRKSSTTQIGRAVQNNSTNQRSNTGQSNNVFQTSNTFQESSTSYLTQFPTNSDRISPKNKTIALGLCLLIAIGLSGFHRIYVGKVRSGILYLLTFGLFGIGAIVDFIKLASDTFQDADGKILTWQKVPPQVSNYIPSSAPLNYSAPINYSTVQTPSISPVLQPVAQPIIPSVASPPIVQSKPKEIKVFSFDEAVTVYFCTEHISCKSIYNYRKYFSDDFSCILHELPEYRIELSYEKVLRQNEILNPVSNMQNITRVTNINKIKDFVAIDVETTGLKPGRNDIIEICAIKFINFKPIMKFHTYLKPCNSIPADATAINHITNDMVADAPKFSQIRSSLQSFIEKLPLVAHNASFDMAFLHVSGLSLDEHASSVYDTLKLARLKIRDDNNEKLESYKLVDICKELNIACSEFHSADSDALACGILFSDIVKRINCVTNVDDLFQPSN